MNNTVCYSFSTLIFHDSNLNDNEIKIPKKFSEDSNYPVISEKIAILTKEKFIFKNQLLTVTGFTNDGSVCVSVPLLVELKSKEIVDDDIVTIAYGFKNNINETEKFVYSFPYKEAVSDLISLEKGIELKRSGKYNEAHTVYLEILSKEQGSSMLYCAMAKNLACMGKYDEAISLFNLANQGYKMITGENDSNCQRHMFMLSNINKIPKEISLEYMRSISGNPNYIFPIEK